MLNPHIHENMGAGATARLIAFCCPGLSVEARRAPMHIADISVPNLRKQFHTINDQHSYYTSFEEFVDALKMFIPGEITEDGIYTNITYSQDALTALVKHAAA